MGNLISPPKDTRVIIPPRFHTRGLTRPVEFEDPMSVQFGSMLRREILMDLHSFAGSFGLDIALAPEIPVTAAACVSLGGSTKSGTIGSGALNLHFNAFLIENLQAVARFSLDHQSGVGGFGMLSYQHSRGVLSAILTQDRVLGVRAESAHVMMGFDPNRAWCIFRDRGLSLGVSLDSSARVAGSVSLEKSIPNTDSSYCVSAKYDEKLTVGFSQHLVTHRKVYNPFEDIKWIANYIDIAVEAVHSDSSTCVSAGASWQPNKNFLAKLHASTIQGVLLTLAVRNWWVPNVLGSVSAGLDVTGEPCLGGRIQIANWVSDRPEYHLVYMEVAQERVIEFDVPAYYAAPPAPAFSAGTALQIEAQTHRTDLNGKYAVAIGRDGMRSLVMTATGDMLSVSDAHLVPAELAEGTRVTVVGLQGELERHNGQTGLITVTGSNGVSVQLGDSTVQIEPINVVITPEGSDEVIVTTTNQPGKRRRLIASLAAAAADFGQLSGAPTLLGGPVGGAASRLMAIDAAVAMSSAQPILKRCGTLRKLVHGFPGFAPLAVCIVAKLHADPSHPARVMEAADASEAMRIASALTEGKMDGVPRKDLATVLSDSTTLEAVLRLADRYCGANHLVFAIDTNFAGVRETIVQMVHGITAGHSAPEPVVPDIPMEEVIGDTPIILPFNNALASRYAPKKQEDDN